MATYKHLRSSTANKRPTTTIADGQLAINTNTASPGLFFKDSAGTGIVKVGPVHVGTTAPNSVPASGGSTGNYTGEQWLDTSVSPAQMKVWNGSTWVGIVADELPVSKLQDGAARQLIQTDAAGTGVEWTSNVDVPGTLDVTSTATFDSIAQYPLGSAAAPTLTFTGDNNTGIYSPGADQVAISTNSSQRLLIDSSGNVGVGTTIASTKLDVAGELTFSAGGAGWRTASLKGIDEGGSFQGSLAFYTHPNAGAGGAPTEKMRLTSAGRLGLGTSSPGARLTVAESASSSDAQIHFRNSAGGVVGGVQGTRINFYNDNGFADATPSAYIQSRGNDGAANGHSSLRFGVYNGSASIEALRIDPSGRVGIGSTAPRALLDIGGSAAFSGGTYQAPKLAVSNGYITVKSDSADGVSRLTLIGDSATGDGTIDWGGNIASSLKFTNNGTERGRWDSSGRFLVGTSSTSSVTRLVVQGNSGDATGAGSLRIARGSSNPANGDPLGYLVFTDSGHTPAAWVVSERDGGTWTSGSSQPTRLVFSTCPDGSASPTERMRITNGGNVLIGCQSLPSATVEGFVATGTSSGNRTSSGSSTSAYNHWVFYNGNGIVGSISTSASATTYATSSDYRLKENVVPLTGAADRVKQLQVHRFNFIADPDTTVDGFLAHEAQAVVPECVTGTKDAVDADGNPVYQGIDQSKLVPLLTAALQEALAEIESLRARLDAAGI